MTKLCPRGKAAAKRKFRVYPSAYANAYASKICAGKIKDPSGVKRKDFRGKKAKGGLMGELNRPDRGYKSGGFIARGCGKVMSNRRKKTKMGRYWEQAKRWFFRKVWSFQAKERCQTKVSKMRPTCQSHTNERLAKGECCQTKKSGR